VLSKPTRKKKRSVSRRRGNEEESRVGPTPSSFQIWLALLLLPDFGPTSPTCLDLPTSEPLVSAPLPLCISAPLFSTNPKNYI